MIILQITFSLLVILIADYFIYKLFRLKRVSYSRQMSAKTAYVGDNVSMIEVIHNKSLLPVPWLVIQTMTDTGLVFKQLSDMHISGPYHRSVFSLMPFTHITRNHFIKCAKRGEYHLSHITLTTGDIFGFISREYEMNFDTSILVYPSLLPRQELMLPFRSLTGEIVIRRYILPDPFMTAGVREYSNNDPMSMINWKTSARVGSLQVYKRDFTSNMRLMIILNIDIDPFYSRAVSEHDQKKMEYAISYCTTLADYATENGFETGFCTNGHYPGKTEPVFIYPQYSYEQYYEILGSLSRLQLESKITIAQTLGKNIERFINMDLLIVTVWVDEKIREAADSVRYNGCNVDFIIIPELDEKAE